MQECFDAFVEASKKLDKVCTDQCLKSKFIGDSYPMCLVVTPDEGDPAQFSIVPREESESMPKIIYRFNGQDIWWTTVDDVTISNTANRKLVNAFKTMCNAYAHCMWSSTVERVQ